MNKTNNINQTQHIGLFEMYIWIVATFILTMMMTINISASYKIYTIIYFLIFIIFLTVSINFIVKNKDICGNNGDDTNSIVYFSIIYPFSYVFLIGVSFIELFPGWLRGFSNTIGLWCVNIFGFKKFIHSLLPKSEDQSGKTEVLNKIYNNPIPLFNELTADSYDETDSSINWPQLQNLIDSGIINKDIQNDSKKILAKYVMGKELVSKFIWYTLLSIITFFISINNVLNNDKCINKNSIDSKEFKNYIATKLD